MQESTPRRRPPVNGCRMKFYTQPVDHTHAAWSLINDDCYLFGIRTQCSDFLIFDSSGRDLDILEDSTPYTTDFHSIPQSDTTTSKRIARFVAEAFSNVQIFQDKLTGQKKLPLVCDLLEEFIIKNRPGTCIIAMVDTVMYHVENVSIDEFTDEEIRYCLFGVEKSSCCMMWIRWPWVNYETCWMGVIDGICSICLDKFEENSRVVKMDCSHYFHKDCILEWTMRKTTCPICRNELECKVLIHHSFLWTNFH